jgi:major membrane immunogen (membrane-anchored lipoprotein)
MIRIALVLFVLVTLTTACEDNNTEGQVDIRLFNASDMCIHEINFNPGSKTTEFGSLATGTYSVYHTFDRAYPVAFVSVRVENDTIRSAVPDYTGGTLQSGSYTFSIYVDTVRKVVSTTAQAD